ncbi:MAG TPA: hypothetical protein PKG51_11240 [Arachnia sp.]|nr:hypothetical protein [Arachnia sp.]
MNEELLNTCRDITRARERDRREGELYDALTTTLYDAAEARVRELFPGDAPEDRWAREYLLDDWPNGTEHWAWVATATEAEIHDWIDEIPSAEDRPDLYEAES